MAVFSGPLQSLIDELGRLPGIGPKSAQRITFHLLKVAPEDAMRLAESIIAVKERITLCTRCFNVAEGELCSICVDERREGPRSASSRIHGTSSRSRRPASSRAGTTCCRVR